ncbi:MAG: aldo/keto reductase [Desulfovibrionaceae bacterium]|nr:aldo/keto reductase [Desulfovibrionaceae bacterium]
MDKIRLGRTGLEVSSVSFGVLPLQRTPMPEATKILRRAYEGGINYYDTARMYSDSEEKLGAAFAGMRGKVIISTKSMGKSGQEMTKELENSLKNLKTDYIDIWQTHNPAKVPVPDDGSGIYEAMLTAQKSGKTRFIGLTNHLAGNAVQAVESGLYDTLQFPFSLLAYGEDLRMPALCREADMGFIAMKALAGGLIRNVPAAFAFIRLHPNAVPIWGIQRLEELEEFLALEANPPPWDTAMATTAEKERAELGGEFCRGCGYCLPCPAEIPIHWLARMIPLLSRSPWKAQYTPKAMEEYNRAANCTHCGNCASRCPYHLDTPRLVETNYKFYLSFLKEKQAKGEI